MIYYLFFEILIYQFLGLVSLANGCQSRDKLLLRRAQVSHELV